MVAPLLRFRDTQAGAYGIPVGLTWIVIGDSISNEVSAGQYATQLGATYSGSFLGRSDPIVNGTMESNITGWNATSNCTLSQATDCPGISDITGAHALKMVATTTALAQCNCGGDVGAFLRLNMAANVPQTFGIGVWVPTGVTGLTLVEIFDRIGSGSYTQTNSATIDVIGTPAQANGWQSVAAIRTAPVGTTEMFVRVVMTAPTAGQNIWIDGAYIVHTLGNVSPAIGGAALAAQSVSGNANSILDNWAARVTAYGTPGVAILAAGTNDFFAQSASYTPALWGAAMQAAIANLKAISPQPVIIVLGIPPAKTTVPTGGLLATGFASGQALRDAMDAQTRASCRAAGVPFVPLADMPLTFTDGIHPDASLLAVGTAGHTWMAQRVKDVMNRVVR